MTVVHAEVIGDRAILPFEELEQLLALARRSDPVEVRTLDANVSTVAMMRLADQGGSFDFWKDQGEDLYSSEDGEPV